MPVVRELTTKQLRAYIEQIPALEYRRHYGTTQLSMIAVQALGSKNVSFEELLPGFARIAETPGFSYDRDEATCISYALRAGLIGRNLVEWVDVAALGRAKA